MQNVKKFFVLFLATCFLYDAAMAGKSKGPELDKQTLARRSIKPKTTKLQAIPRAIAHTKKRFSILSQRRAGQPVQTKAFSKAGIAKGKKVLVQPTNLLAKRALLKARPTAVKGNKVVLQPTNLLAKRALLKARTTAVKGNKAVLQPTNLLAKRALSKTRTTAVKGNKAVAQPTKTFLTQQGRALTRKAKKMSGTLGKRVNRIIKPTQQDVRGVRRGTPASLKNNTSSQDSANKAIMLKTADLPPAVLQELAARGQHLPAVQKTTHEEIRGILFAFERLEQAGNLPAGTALHLRNTLRNKYQVTL